MPRSTKSTAGSTTTSKKRAGKKSISKDPLYDIPASPDCKESTPVSDCGHSISSTAVSDAENMSQASNKSKRRTVKASIPLSDPDATPKQVTTIKMEETVGGFLPGFEAIEAVNGLYQKLKASQSLVADLQRENRRLLETAKAKEQEVQTLQAELTSTSDQLERVLQEPQDKTEEEAANKLDLVMASIRAFKDAAQGIMPLLDVITEAADIEYDGPTESLYQIMKGYNRNATG